MDRGEIADTGVSTIRIVPALDVLEYGHAGLGLGAESAPVEEFAFEGREEAFAPGVVESPADPIEGRTPACRQRWPKATEVYWEPCSE